MTAANGMFSDDRVSAAISPEVIAFLQSNQPSADTEPDFQIGHWMGVTATVLTKLAETRQQLAVAKQKINELEADA